MTQPDKGHGNLLQKLFLMNINTLEEEQVEDFAKKIKSERRDEELSQLTIYTLEEVTARTFVRKLAEREKFQNWEIQEAPLVFKM